MAFRGSERGGSQKRSGSSYQAAQGGATLMAPFTGRRTSVDPRAMLGAYQFKTRTGSGMHPMYRPGDTSGGAFSVRAEGGNRRPTNFSGDNYWDDVLNKRMGGDVSLTGAGGRWAGLMATHGPEATYSAYEAWSQDPYKKLKLTQQGQQPNAADQLNALSGFV